jgi:hypothetical protein
MPHVPRQQQDLALPDRHLPRPALLQDPQDHVAAQLIEEFLVGIVVIVGPGWTADHHHDQVAGLHEHLLIADRRLELLRMPVDPLREVECGQRHAAILLIAQSTELAQY